MADQAVSTSSASIFMDDLRSSISGECNYTPVTADDDGWVYSEYGVTHNGTDILFTDRSYLGQSGAVATTDKVKWIAIKNVSTTPTEGVGISLAGGSTDGSFGLAAYNAADTIILGNGEMVVLKTPNLTVAGLHGKSCTLDSNGKPSAQGTATVNIQIAAILEDVSA